MRAVPVPGGDGAPDGRPGGARVRQEMVLPLPCEWGSEVLGELGWTAREFSAGLHHPVGAQATAAAQPAEAIGGAGGGVAPASREAPHLPQEQRLKAWFESKGIDIHEYTMPLLVDVHRRIHHPPPKEGTGTRLGGSTGRHLRSAKEEIMRDAGQLIYEFELAGPVVPY